MKRCYIHIGVHKTGSTSIQHALGQNIGDLAKKGIHIPAAGRAGPDNGAHHNLAFEINQDPRFRPGKGTMKSLVAELGKQQPETVLLSTEAFCFSIRRTKRLRALRDPLVALGYEIVWIVYLRSYPEWAESAYTELSKSSAIQTDFETWVNQGGPALVIGRNPGVYMNPLRATGDKIILRSYANALPDLIGDFFARIGLENYQPKAPFGEIRANARPKVLAMEFFRLTAALAARAASPGARKAILTQAAKLRRKLPDSPPYRGLSADFARRLRESTRPQFSMILQVHRPDQAFEDFFPLKPSYELSTIETCDAPPEHLLALYQTITRLCLDAPPRRP